MLNEETYQAQYGEPWPLIVKGGKLYCAGSKADPQVIFEAEGTVYGVNGNAAGRIDGPSLWYGKTEIKSLKYGNINEIRKSDPGGPMYGLMLTGAMIEEGLNLCPEK